MNEYNKQMSLEKKYKLKVVFKLKHHCVNMTENEFSNIKEKFK